MADAPDKTESSGRRSFLREVARWLGALALLWLPLRLARRGSGGEANTVWQIDPYKCIQCGNCATACVLSPSAAKCVHAFAMCGYCDICSGYYRQDYLERDTAAENQLCPIGAIKRTFVEDPYFQYTVDEEKCVGCGRCVKGCYSFGNGSLFLQIRHDRCVNCNQCNIALSCPAQAVRRVPETAPYLLKRVENA